MLHACLIPVFVASFSCSIPVSSLLHPVSVLSPFRLISVWVFASFLLSFFRCLCPDLFLPPRPRLMPPAASSCLPRLFFSLAHLSSWQFLSSRSPNPVSVSPKSCLSLFQASYLAFPLFSLVSLFLHAGFPFLESTLSQSVLNLAFPVAALRLALPKRRLTVLAFSHVMALGSLNLASLFLASIPGSLSSSVFAFSHLTRLCFF